MARSMCLAIACVASAIAFSQTVPKGQQKPTPAQPPTQGTPPPPPPPPQNGTQGLTPPIQPKTTVPQTPPDVDVSPPPGLQPVNAPLTAQEAAQIALRYQPSVAIALAQVEQAKGLLITQQAAEFPTVEATQTYLRQETIHGVTGGNTSRALAANAQGFSGGLVLNQLIFDFNHTRDLVKQNAAEVRSYQHSYSKAQIDAILLVKTAFYTFVQNEGLVKVQQANVDSAQASLDLAQASLNAGLGAPADVISARTTLANDIQALVQAKATATTSRISLCLDMGIDPRTPIVPSDATEPQEPSADVNVMVSQAIKDRPDMLASLELVKAAGYGVSAARTSNAPSFNLQVGLTNNGYSVPLTSDSLSAGLTVTWLFEDGGAAAGRVETAHGVADQAKANLQQTTLQVINDVTSAYVNVKSSEERVQVADTQVENAQKNVELAQGQYKAGVTPFVTVITAQAELEQAQSDQVTAVANLAQARATLTHALGH